MTRTFAHHRTSTFIFLMRYRNETTFHASYRNVVPVIHSSKTRKRKPKTHFFSHNSKKLAGPPHVQFLRRESSAAFCRSVNTRRTPQAWYKYISNMKVSVMCQYHLLYIFISLFRNSSSKPILRYKNIPPPPCRGYFRSRHGSPVPPLCPHRG